MQETTIHHDSESVWLRLARMKINEKALVSDVRSGRLPIDQSLLQVLSNKTIQSLMLAFYTFTDARESPNKRFRLSQDGVEISVVRENIKKAV